MQNISGRKAQRSSFFLTALAELGGRELPVKVRNLSTGGMMVEADCSVIPGARIAIELRNIGRVNGTVAWAETTRFGVAFDREIDPQAVTCPDQKKSGHQPPPYLRQPLFDEHYRKQAAIRRV